ncbi:MAG: type III pantothenate kinase [Ruminococcaceae bacterium]|nr:type III pantothenate kinase [Oscillospiraceae bacterium]
MILAIDIGNTNVALGGFNSAEPSFVALLSTNCPRTDHELCTQILSILSLYRIESSLIEGVIISSVVPKLTPSFKNVARMLFDTDALVVGPGIKTGLNIRCDIPSSVGSDLICACVASNALYGAPCIIVDMGTATKVIAVDGSASFAGVSITAGVEIALSSLTDNAAQLFSVGMDAPKNAIGKNTADSLRSGAIFGNAGMIDALTRRFEEELGDSPKLIATGNLSELIIPHCQRKYKQDKDLVLKGLYFIYQKNCH